MRSWRNTTGASLLEVLLGVSLLCATIIVFALSGSKMTSSLVEDKRRQAARNLAVTKLQELTGKPYGLLRPTPDGAYFTGAPASQPAGTCDCRTVNFQAMPLSGTVTTLDWQDQPLADVQTIDTVRFERRVCIGEMDRTGGGAYVAQCAWTASPNLKLVKVAVRWTYNGQANSLSLEKMVSR